MYATATSHADLACALSIVMDMLKKPEDKSFASSLVAGFEKYKSFTDKQVPYVRMLIDRALPSLATQAAEGFHVVPGTAGVEHTIPVAPVAAAPTGGFEAIHALLVKASASKLKKPKIVIATNATATGKLVFSLTGSTSKKPGHVAIASSKTYGAGKFYGYITPQGVLEAKHDAAALLGSLLLAFSDNPAAFLAKNGKAFGQCCMCSLPLSDADSVQAGYGKICAGKYGLPYGKKAFAAYKEAA